MVGREALNHQWVWCSGKKLSKKPIASNQMPKGCGFSTNIDPYFLICRNCGNEIHKRHAMLCAGGTHGLYQKAQVAMYHEVIITHVRSLFLFLKKRASNFQNELKYALIHILESCQDPYSLIGISKYF